MERQEPAFKAEAWVVLDATGGHIFLGPDAQKQSLDYMRTAPGSLVSRHTAKVESSLAKKPSTSTRGDLT
jgi:hypothetical protein